jgi:hypothetical protein
MSALDRVLAGDFRRFQTVEVDCVETIVLGTLDDADEVVAIEHVFGEGYALWVCGQDYEIDAATYRQLKSRALKEV